DQNHLSHYPGVTKLVVVVPDIKITFDHHVLAEDLSGSAACQIKKRNVGRFEVYALRYRALCQRDRERDVNMGQVEAACDARTEDLDTDRVHPPASFRVSRQPSDQISANVPVMTPCRRVLRTVALVGRVSGRTRINPQRTILVAGI